MLNGVIRKRQFNFRISTLFFICFVLLCAIPGLIAQQSSTVIYENNFVPDGAVCKIAFITDHHYWPDHPKNWGGGSQQTSHSNERMLDLIEVLNAEAPDVSVHGGDVISAGGAFFPPPDEYRKQLAFEKRLFDNLNHHVMPAIGNHETLEGHYTSESQLQEWINHFGNPYQSHDVNGWRMITLNSLLPNPNDEHGRGNVYRNSFGIDDRQMDWLKDKLKDATARDMKVLLFAHVPPLSFENLSEFEELAASSDCIKGMMFGHWHRNYLYMCGGVPVMVRISNVASPMGYSMLHCYPDGKIIVVQKSQHFPFQDFVSSAFARNVQGSEMDRYLTLGGTSTMPVTGLKIIGDGTKARIVDGHLRLSSGRSKGIILIDTADLQKARLSFTAVKARGSAMGAIALANSDGSGGFEAVLTSRSSPDGQMYLAKREGENKEVQDRNWFNIKDDVAYNCTVEVRNGTMTVSWKNMPELSASVDENASGQFGLFIENGTMFVTDIKLEKLQ